MAAVNLVAALVCAGTSVVMSYRRRLAWAVTLAGLAGLNVWLFWR